MPAYSSLFMTGRKKIYNLDEYDDVGKPLICILLRVTTRYVQVYAEISVPESYLKCQIYTPRSWLKCQNMNSRILLWMRNMLFRVYCIMPNMGKKKVHLACKNSKTLTTARVIGLQPVDEPHVPLITLYAAATTHFF